MYSTGASVHDSGVPVTSTDVMDAGLDSVGVGPAMLDIADVEIVTPYLSVLSLSPVTTKKSGKEWRKGHTTAAHRCWENICPISTSSGAHPSQHTYLSVISN